MAILFFLIWKIPLLDSPGFFLVARLPKFAQKFKKHCNVHVHFLVLWWQFCTFWWGLCYKELWQFFLLTRYKCELCVFQVFVSLKNIGFTYGWDLWWVRMLDKKSDLGWGGGVSEYKSPLTCQFWCGHCHSLLNGLLVAPAIEVII